MNNRFLYAYGFWPVELLVAIGVVFGVAYWCREMPDGPIARLMRHRDRIWFVLLLLFLPAILSRFVLFHLLFRYVTLESYVSVQNAIMIFNVFYGLACGAAYGMAGCCIASPAPKEGRINGWTSLTVSVVLMVLISGLSLLISAFRIIPSAKGPIIMAAVIILAFLVSRAFVGKSPAPQTETATNVGLSEKEYNPVPAFLWLLVGLAPIPVLLALISSQGRHDSWVAAILIGCALCNLLVGLGCLGGIKNVGVRVILGLFLAVFLFLLSWIVAVFHACSGASI